MKRAAQSISLLLLAAASLATACATGAKSGGMSPGGPLEHREFEAADVADLPTLTLQTTGGRATNPFHTSQISNGAFTEALAMEILRRGAFRPVDDQVADYHLHVHLVEIDQPFWGWLDMEVRIDAEWRLFEAESGELVWEQRVQSTHTATGDDSSLGIRRLRLANEGSARQNIAEGVSALAHLAPERPRR